MNHSTEMRNDAVAKTEFVPTGKLVDLLSRVNGGVINIPDFDLRSENRDRRVDTVCVTIALLKERFGENLKVIPRSLLRFIAHTKFRYGVRSIAHLIDVIDSEAFREGTLKGAALGLPTNSEETLEESSLKLHLLDKDQGFGIVNRWRELAKDKAIVDLSPQRLQQFLRVTRLAPG